MKAQNVPEEELGQLLRRLRGHAGHEALFNWRGDIAGQFASEQDGNQVVERIHAYVAQVKQKAHDIGFRRGLREVGQEISAPGMTDLMVPPETIPDYQPPEDAVSAEGVPLTRELVEALWEVARLMRVEVTNEHEAHAAACKQRVAWLDLEGCCARALMPAALASDGGTPEGEPFFHRLGCPKISGRGTAAHCTCPREMRAMTDEEMSASQTAAPLTESVKTYHHNIPTSDNPEDHSEGNCPCNPIVDEAAGTVTHQPMPALNAASGPDAGMQLHLTIFKPNGKYYTGGLVEVPNKRPEIPQLYHDPNFEAIARAQQLLQDESFRSRRWLIVATVPSEYDADPECGWWPMCWPPMPEEE